MFARACPLILSLYLPVAAQADCGWADATMMQDALADSKWAVTITRFAVIEGGQADIRQPVRTGTMQFNDDMTQVRLEDDTLSLALAEGVPVDDVTIPMGRHSFTLPIGSTEGSACEDGGLPEIFGIGRTRMGHAGADMRLQLRVRDADELIGVLQVQRVDAFGATRAIVEQVHALPAPSDD